MLNKIIFALFALTVTACGASNIVTTTINDAGYRDVESRGTYTEGLGKYYCTGASVAHVFSGVKNGHKESFSVCCRNEGNTNTCETVPLF